MPHLGLPKMSSLVTGIFIPTFSDSPLWSMSAKSVMPLDLSIRSAAAEGAVGVPATGPISEVACG
jgi:hypothetical protein